MSHSHLFPSSAAGMRAPEPPLLPAPVPSSSRSPAMSVAVPACSLPSRMSVLPDLDLPLSSPAGPVAMRYEEFFGNDAGLFASAESDEADKKADAIWEAIDHRMASRRMSRKEARLKEQIEKRRVSNPMITLKRKMYTMSVQDWDSILPPNKKQTVSDPRLEDKASVLLLTLDRLPESVMVEKASVLSSTLDVLSDCVSGLVSNRVDPEEYLTELDNMKIVSSAEISAIKKDRSLLKSLIRANPKYPRGWIAAARFEEMAGEFQKARQLIKRGCEECPKNEDIWIEASRLSRPHEAKAVIARGVKSIPNSVKLWMQAAKLEDDDRNKSRVFRKALERIPDSVSLWKAAVELANEEEAKLLLQMAVECRPLNVELWLVLAGLEKKVLNKARDRLSEEPAIWIAVAKLEEANRNTSTVGKIIERGIRALQGGDVVIDRAAWIKEAEAAEKDGFVVTCQAIIRYTIGIGVEEEDRKTTWIADAEECKKKGCIETARAIYAHALTIFLTKKSIWIKAAKLEKKHGTRMSQRLQQAVKYRPQVEVMWLMCDKEWLTEDVPAARAILQEARASIYKSEDIWLAASKLEFENNEPERARMLLAKAMTLAPDIGDFWAFYYIIELRYGSEDTRKELIDRCVAAEPKHGKKWQSVAKAPENSHQPTVAILKKVAVALGSDEEFAVENKRWSNRW